MLLLRAVIGIGELVTPPASDPEPHDDIKLEYFPSSLPGSRMGRWDHCMRLQTPSTSVPVMVSTIPVPLGGQNPAFWGPWPSVSSASQGSAAREAELSPLAQVSSQTCPLLRDHITGSSQAPTVWHLFG